MKSNRVAALLREQKAELVALWHRSVFEDPAVTGAARRLVPTLREDVPALIDRMASAVERSDSLPVEAAGAAVGQDGIAIAEALHRFDASFTLEAALRELSHFRSATADIFYRLGVLPTPVEFRVMNVTIDETMALVAARMRDADHARVTALNERFVAILGHDLRNPLNAITISADTLLRRSLPEREVAGIRRIARAAGHMARMIHDIYEFASVRFGRGGIELATQRSSIVELCSEVIDEMKLVHGSRTILFEPREDAHGAWDRTRIRRALSNVLGNALTYSPPDTEVRLGVSVNGSRAAVTIHNHGEPIDAAILPAVFEPFARGHTGRSETDGLGLGLFIAREITRAHGGEIRLESARGQGTFLTVELPLEPTIDASPL